MAEFFQHNLIFVHLIYGFAFLALGLVLSLLVRTPLRPPSLASLWLLAGFGLLHGLLEWTDMAILIEQQVGNSGTVAVLRLIALGLTPLSFAFLLQFGTDVLALARVMLVIWLLLTFVIGSAITPIGSLSWITSGQVVARYLVGFPGSMLTSAAL